MKKTNLAFLHSVAKKLFFLPLFLCFVLLSSSDLVAQNFVSLDDAIVSVKEAMGELVDDLPSTDRDGSLTSSDTETNLKWVYYSAFLKKAEELKSVQGAVNYLNTVYHVQKFAGDPELKQTMEDIDEALMEMITD